MHNSAARLFYVHMSVLNFAVECLNLTFNFAVVGKVVSRSLKAEISRVYYVVYISCFKVIL